MAPTYNMKSQRKPWSCGTAAVRNILRIYGKKVSEVSLWSSAGLTKEFGTSEHGIMEALGDNGFEAIEHHFSNKDEAWQWLHGALNEGRPVILAVECWEHWVVAIGSLGSTGVAIFDPSNWKYNLSENGTYVWDKKKLMYKWFNNRMSVCDETEKRLYAISVSKK